MKILVYSEKPEVGYELLGKAQELGAEVAAAVLGAGDPQGYVDRGATRVYHAKEEALNSLDAAACADTLAQIAAKAGTETIMIGSTRRGKELAGRLAQKLGAGCITDVNNIQLQDGKLVCSRNAYGGATVATQVVLTDKQVIAVMPRSFNPAEPGKSGGVVEEIAVQVKPSRIKIVERVDKRQGTVDLEAAEILVCVGKGLAKQEDLAMINELAAALGGAVGCSKPIATDEKWLPEDLIIGLSGKKCKPQLAIVLGISGQVQFTVGIREAKTIVAVNNDQNAYIFQMADYGIVGDIYEVVPRLTAALKK